MVRIEVRLDQFLHLGFRLVTGERIFRSTQAVALDENNEE